jgi:chromosome partitioning protein
MSPVITIAQQKGGAGKTVLGINLATALGTKHCVAVLDPQARLARWRKLRERQARPLPIITAANVSDWPLQTECNRLRKSHDAVFADNTPHICTDAKLGVREADLALLPLQLKFLAAQQMVALFAEALPS